eukprot:3909760-Pleurochrysis_carterae.AAC.2
MAMLKLERTKISGHSFHGSPSDIARLIGSGNPMFIFFYKTGCARARPLEAFLLPPPSQDEEDTNPRASAHSTSTAERDGSSEMDLHYTSGDGRTGHRSYSTLVC